MTNEQLVIEIQKGNKDLYLTLWIQVKNLITLLAKKYLDRVHANTGAELEDLEQSGYLALVEAAEAYNPESGYKFTTFLSKSLLNAFNEAGFNRSDKQKQDPLKRYTSLYSPVSNDSTVTYEEIIEDEGPSNIKELEDRLFNEELREALDKALAAIPEPAAVIIKDAYYYSKTIEEIAEDRNLDPNQVKKRKAEGINKLRKNAHDYHLDKFIDQRTPFYMGVGPAAFQRSGESPVEKLVFLRESMRKNKKK